MYSREKENKQVLDCVLAAAIDLQSKDDFVETCQISVDADFLLHVYDLLLAYAYTYEGHQADPCLCSYVAQGELNVTH